MVDIIRKSQTQPTSNLSSRPFPVTSDLGRLLRDFLRWEPGHEIFPLFRGHSFSPAFEAKETPQEYIFKGDLPGVKEEDITVQVAGNRLTVSGKRDEEVAEENETLYLDEAPSGVFRRSFTLPEVVNPDDCRAELKNGRLVITLPKRPEAQPKQVPIGRSSAERGEGRQKRDSTHAQS